MFTKRDLEAERLCALDQQGPRKSSLLDSTGYDTTERMKPDTEAECSVEVNESIQCKYDTNDEKLAFSEKIEAAESFDEIQTSLRFNYVTIVRSWRVCRVKPSSHLLSASEYSYS
jgi:hypothetical protein